MMRKIIERPKALEDLNGIADYIAVDNPDAARRVISAIADTYLHIVEWPELSKLVDKRLRVMSVVGFRQYLVIYTWSDRRFEDEEKNTNQWRYYLTSLITGSPMLFKLVRQHWSIENQCYWILDVTFDEDPCRVRKGQCSR